MILLNFLLTIYYTNKVIFRNAFGTIADNMGAIVLLEGMLISMF